jgi:hypothetical protein
MPEFKKRFNLKSQLLKDKMAAFANRKPIKITPISINMFDQDDKKPLGQNIVDEFNKNTQKQVDEAKRSVQNFRENIAAIPGDAARKQALPEFKKRLSNPEFDDVTDQFGQYQRRQDGQGYSTRGLNVPFDNETTYRGDDKNLRKLSKKYPYLASYLKPKTYEINPFVKDLQDPDYVNQQMRNMRAGADYDMLAVNQGQANRGGLLPFSKPGIDPFQAVVGPNAAKYDSRMFELPTGKLMEKGSYGAENQNALALAAVNASDTARTALQQALAAEDYAAAEGILADAQSLIEKDFFSGDAFSGATRGSGRRMYLNSPGVFFGNRVKDNLAFRSGEARKVYNQQLDKAASQDIKSYLRLMLDKPNRENFSADVRSGNSMFNL